MVTLSRTLPILVALALSACALQGGTVDFGRPHMWAKIAIQVRDADTGEVLPGARVQATGTQAQRTDAAGWATLEVVFREPKAGQGVTWQIWADARGYAQSHDGRDIREQAVQVYPATTTTAVIALVHL